MAKKKDSGWGKYQGVCVNAACGRFDKDRRRGLCRVCYADPAIRLAHGGPSKRKEDDPAGYSAVPEEADAPQWLRDMWHVYHRPKGEDKTAAQRDLRKMREKDFGKFLALLKETEKEWRRWGVRPAGAGSAGPAAVAPAAEEPIEDAGSDRAEALMEKLLRERPWEGGS